MSILEIVLASYILISWLLVIISITFGNNDTFIGIVMMIVCPPLILGFISQAIHYHIKEKQANKEAKARAFDLEQQKALEAEALKEYTELVAKNDLVRDEFLKEEQALKQQLILKHCKDIDKHVWSDGTITYYCRRW